MDSERRKPRLVSPRQRGVVYNPRGGARKLFVSPDLDEKDPKAQELIRKGLSYICAKEVLIEGPAGTGKTYAVLQLIYDLIRKYPGMRVLFTRESRSSMSETILKTWENHVLGPNHYSYVGGATRSHRKSYVFRNGSEVHIIGMSNVDSIMSGEYDLIAYFEIVDEERENVWSQLQTRLRNQKVPHPRGYANTRGYLNPEVYNFKLKRPIPKSVKTIWELKRRGWFAKGAPLEGARWPDGTDIFWHLAIGDCNPGSPHHWVNRRADRKADDGSPMMVRILSQHKDNPTCTETYLESLRNQPPEIRARYYEGRWVAAEGAIYPAFNAAKHCVPFNPKWNFSHYVGGIDWGYDAAGVFQVWGVNYGGMVRVEEVYFSQRQQAWWEQVIVDAAEKYDMPIIVADPANPQAIDSMNARLSLSRARTRVKKADNAILPGIDAVRYGLDPGMGQPPKLLLAQGPGTFPVGHDSRLQDKEYPVCTEQEIPNYVWDEWIPGKPFKERPKVGQHDHGLDVMRYVAMEVMRPGYLKEEEMPGDFEVHSWTREYCERRLALDGQRRNRVTDDAEILQFE